MSGELIICTRAWVPKEGEPFFQYQAMGSGPLADSFFEWLDRRGFVAMKQKGPWTHWVFSQSLNDELIRHSWGSWIQDEPTHFECIDTSTLTVLTILADDREIAYRAAQELSMPQITEIRV